MQNRKIPIDDVTPTDFYLSQNFPNPFKDKTSIKFCVGSRTRVTLKVYDSNGHEIKKLVDAKMEPGTYQVEFVASECNSYQGGHLKGGSYLYLLEADDFKYAKKMSLI